MMTKTKRVILFLVFILFSNTKGQTIHQIGYFNVNGVSAMSAKPNYMVLGTGAVVNITDPTLPNLSGNISMSAMGSAVLVSGNHAYFGTAMDVKLIIADISNPSFPLQVGVKTFPSANGGIYGLAKSDNVIYLAMGSNGVYSVDVAMSNNPVVLDSITFTGGQARDVVQYDNVLYVAHGDGLKILNVNDPSNINLISSIGSGYTSIDIDTINHLAFLGKDFGGIDVFNVSNPQSPAPAFSIPNPNGASWDLKYRDGLLYLATNNSGLFIYKVLSASATQMANFPNSSNGQSFAVSLQDSLILLSGLINGVAILQYDSLGTVSINDEITADPIIVYPNPAQNYLEIILDDAAFTEFEIINSTGQCVLKNILSDKNCKIDISLLPAGNYYIQFKNNNSVVHRNFIKSH